MLLGIVTFIAVVLSSISVSAQDSKEDAKAAAKADKTGTNPINFQNELRIYNEYTWLNTDGDGNQNLTTLEYRTPFLDGKWQYRLRAKYNAIKADINDDGSDELDASGFGDLDMRFLTVPYLNVSKKMAFAAGLELFLDTASDDELGSGAWTLGPQVFYVKFLQRGLFAPGLQYKISVEEDSGRDEVNQILIDLNYLFMSKDKQSWFFTDPQIVFDFEKDTEFAIVDFEFGAMLSKWTDLQGQSIYIRPSIGVGTDRPSDYSVEVGYKFVW